MTSNTPLHVLLREFEEPATPYAVAKRLGISHASVLRRVKRLEAAGALRKVQPTKTNIPGYYYVLTEKGKELLRIAEELHLTKLIR